MSLELLINGLVLSGKKPLHKPMLTQILDYMTDGWDISYEIALGLMSLGLTEHAED